MLNRQNKRNFVHGDVGSPEYEAWSQMKTRCYNPRHHAYVHYGGRGIRVCSRWRSSYLAFLEDVGRRPSPKHSLDRYPDLNGDYRPGNVRWATSSQQLRNTRSSHRLTYRGKTMSIVEWAEYLHIPRSIIDTRLRRGWSTSAILTTPMRSYPRKERAKC